MINSVRNTLILLLFCLSISGCAQTRALGHIEELSTLQRLAKEQEKNDKFVEEVDAKLKQIMQDIHSSCVEYGTNEDGSVDYIKGANIAGFVKVADAMLAQGVV